MNTCKRLHHSHSSTTIHNYSESMIIKKLIFSLNHISNHRSSSLLKVNYKNIKERIKESLEHPGHFSLIQRPSKDDISGFKKARSAKTQESYKLEVSDSAAKREEMINYPEKNPRNDLKADKNNFCLNDSNIFSKSLIENAE